MDPKDILNSVVSDNNGSTNTHPTTLLNQDNLKELSNVLPGTKNADSAIEIPAKKMEEVSDNGSSSKPNTGDANGAENEGPKPGDKVDVGKQLNENGEVEDSSTKKTLKAVGRGAAAYFSGGETIGKDSQVLNSAPVDKTIGVVSDQLEKVPGVEELSKELDEAGIADGVNDALDMVGNVKNGDIAGAIESTEKLKKDTKKLKKAIIKKVMMIVTFGFLVVFFLAVIVAAVLGPIIGGFLDVVEDVGDGFSNIGNIIIEAGDKIGNLFADEQQKAGQIIGEIEDFENLSEDRQKILQAAASAVAAKVPYSYGSHPTAAGIRGIPEAGLDCAGFVQWALWTGLGGNPGYLTTEAISNKIGSDFIQISESELQPGDIALKRTGGSNGDDYNHAGIYAGNNQWFHAAGGKTRKVVRGNYNNFTIFLRYKGVN